MRNYRRTEIEDVGLGDSKSAAEEHHAYSYSEKHAAEKTVEHQEAVIYTCAVDIAFLAAEFIAHRLKYEAHQNEHPEPVGTAETCAVEERE